MARGPRFKVTTASVRAEIRARWPGSFYCDFCGRGGIEPTLDKVLSGVLILVVYRICIIISNGICFKLRTEQPELM
jgi:hypothetical protein